jgi:hypothetical protein
MKTFNQNICACELNHTSGMAQRAYIAEMFLELIINRTNTFLRFQVSLFYTVEPEMSFFSFQIPGHPSVRCIKNTSDSA